MRKSFKNVQGGSGFEKTDASQREAFFLKINEAKKNGHVHFAVSFSSAGIIDKKGIVSAIKSALNRSLKKVEKNFVQGLPLYKPRSDLCTKVRPCTNRGPTLNNCRVLLDGNLKAPQRYTNQKTIIGGDDKEPVIRLLQFVQKSLRDRKMTRMARKYPHYGFEVHKGYGTKAHYKAIKSMAIQKSTAGVFRGK